MLDRFDVACFSPVADAVLADVDVDVVCCRYGHQSPVTDMDVIHENLGSVSDLSYIHPGRSGKTKFKKIH